MSDPSNPFKAILSPIKIGPVELKNRIVLAPMNETMSGHNGRATEQMLAYSAARAKGGTAMGLLPAALMRAPNHRWSAPGGKMRSA